MCNSRSVVCTLIAGFAASASALAQWTPEDAVYQIHRAGFFGADYTSPLGLQSSAVVALNESGWIIGTSTRYRTDGQINGQDAYLFDGEGTHQIGLVGGVYTAASGYQYSRSSFLNEAGQAAGSSRRLDAAGAAHGEMAWVYNGTTTIELGFSGGVYTREDLYQKSAVSYFNNAGQVTGNSDRFGAASLDLGQDAWLWTGTTLRQIGFTTPQHTGQSGLRFSQVVDMNDSGAVLGYSTRYFPGSDASAGQDVWLVNGLITRQLGFTGPGFETAEGFRYSLAYRLNASGQVAGDSARYSGDLVAGQDAWLFDGLTTRPLGLTGPNYTNSFGVGSSSVAWMNDLGMVVGTSDRYLNSTYAGRDTWLFDGVTTRQIGLVGGVYTNGDGAQLSSAAVVTPGGLVEGTSVRYPGSLPERGHDAWVFNGTTTRQVGLTGGVYTGANGRQQSDVARLVDGVRAAGISYRYTGTYTDNGLNAWYWTGSSTRQIGMTDATHTGANGYQYCAATTMNSDGVTIGYARRYGVNGAANGTTAWYYDPATNTTWPIVGAVRLGDGYSESNVRVLTEDGFLLGSYLVFTSPLDEGELRAFIFRPDRGMTDLGSLVSGGLAASGWNTLQSPQGYSASNAIAGYGLVAGQTTGRSVFSMISPSCPDCAADYDQDGGVTGGDIGAFFADFETGDSCADVDFDGGITGGDLGAFFVVFEAGGC